MKEEQLDQAINFLISSLQDGKDFVKEQAPLVVQEMIMWGKGSAIFGIICGLICLCFTIYFLHLWKFGIKEGDEQSIKLEDNGILWLGFAGTFLTFIVGLIITLVNMYSTIYIFCAPRLFVLEQIHNLVQH